MIGAVRRTIALWIVLFLVPLTWWVIAHCPCVDLDAAPLLTTLRAAAKLSGLLLLSALAYILVLWVVLAVIGVAPGRKSPRKDVKDTVPTRDEWRDLSLYAHADGAYANPGRRPFRYVERFWLEGGVLGFVDKRPDEDTTYVVFRGTSEVGNWFLTNAQAHMWKASVVFGADLPGGVHGGFVKAFFDLWRGASEPKMVSAEPYGATRFVWPVWMAMVTAFGWIPAAFRPVELRSLSAWCVFGLVVLTLAAIQVIVSHGIFESRFLRRQRLVLGDPLRCTLLRNASRRVVFSGHSLGGALATLAFVDFCERRVPDVVEEVKLVTFGAPIPGNDEFVNWLGTRQVAGQTVTVIANCGDPVAHLPPAASFPYEALRRVTPLSALLAAVYWIGWYPYACCYGVSLGRAWSDLTTWQGKDEGLLIAQHSEY